MIDDILAKFDGAFAKNTIRAYQVRLYSIPNLVLHKQSRANTGHRRHHGNVCRLP